MKINEVITEAIIAIYMDVRLSDILVLKGGAAMRLFDNLDSRLSIDADFSVKDSIGEKDSFFNSIETALRHHFGELEYELIDFKQKRKPKRPKEQYPAWWGGWSCEFKLVSNAYRDKTLESKRRYALKPEGTTSPKISLDISEHEFCGKQRIRTTRGVRIHGYSKELMFLEKLRAICQQHPDYAYRLSKNRARDFYDIYGLTIDQEKEYLDRCQKYIEPVFAAKKVPISLLNSLWDEDFIDEMRRGFDLVRDTVEGPLHDFEVYAEHLRFLVLEVCPDLQSQS